MKSINAAVADAGPLIHLDELNWLFVLELFEAVWGSTGSCGGSETTPSTVGKSCSV